MIADWRLRISDLELMNSFSIRAIRNPQFNGFSVHLRVLSVVNKVLEVLLDLGFPQNVGPLTALTVSSIPSLRFDDLRHTIITAPGRNRMPDNAPSSRLCGIRYGACWSIYFRLEAKRKTLEEPEAAV